MENISRKQSTGKHRFSCKWQTKKVSQRRAPIEQPNAFNHQSNFQCQYPQHSQAQWHSSWITVLQQNLMKQFHNINRPSDVLVSMEDRPSQRDVSWDTSWTLQLKRLSGQTARGGSAEKGCKSEMLLHLLWSWPKGLTEWFLLWEKWFKLGF